MITFDRINYWLSDVRDMYRYGGDDDQFEEAMVHHRDPYALCTECTSDGEPTPRGIARAERFIRIASNWWAWQWRLHHLTEDMKQAMRMLVCEVKSHSSIGPDSGTERHFCTRCGWSWSHTYY